MDFDHAENYGYLRCPTCFEFDGLQIDSIEPAMPGKVAVRMHCNLCRDCEGDPSDLRLIIDSSTDQVRLTWLVKRVAV